VARAKPVSRALLPQWAARLIGFAALGAIGALTADSEEARVRRAERGGSFPSSHLLALPFSLPPGLTLQKWILLDTPDPNALDCLRWVVVDYAIAGKWHERVWVPFRRPNARSEWQKHTCERTTYSPRY
jgi:hypothetical protein